MVEAPHVLTQECTTESHEQRGPGHAGLQSKEQRRGRGSKVVRTGGQTDLQCARNPLGEDSHFNKGFWKTRSTCTRLKLHLVSHGACAEAPSGLKI